MRNSRKEQAASRAIEVALKESQSWQMSYCFLATLFRFFATVDSPHVFLKRRQQNQGK
jgi:hypothetical protein